MLVKGVRYYTLIGGGRATIVQTPNTRNRFIAFRFPIS